MEKMLSACKKELKRCDKELEYTIHNENFIKANMNFGSNKLYPTNDSIFRLGLLTKFWLCNV